MAAWGWILIGIAAALTVAVVATVAEEKRRRARSDRLRERFGPEYLRLVTESDSTRHAESELEAREIRRQELDIRPLAPAARQRFANEWQALQASFVDDPGRAVRHADRLVERVMIECGYPIEDFDHRAADVSVDHPELVAVYRAAHQIYESYGRGTATTEDLRHAIVDYRALFDELLAPQLELVG